MGLTLQRIWAVLRELTGDDAYERYLAHWRAHHSTGSECAARPRGLLPRGAAAQVGRRPTLLLSASRLVTRDCGRLRAARAARRRARRLPEASSGSAGAGSVPAGASAGRFAETEHLRRVRFVLNLLDGLLGKPANLALGLVVEHDEADTPIHRIQRILGDRAATTSPSRRRAGSCSPSCRPATSSRRDALARSAESSQFE